MRASVWVGFSNFLNKEKFLPRAVNGNQAFSNKFLPCG
jgi:hypothetical protein